MEPAAFPLPPALPTADATRSSRRLWLYGLGMLGPAIYFAWRYPLRSNSDHLVDIGKLARYEVDAFILFVGGISLLFALYVLAVWESRRLPARRALPVVFGCGTLLAAAMAWMYPVNAIDLFLYAVRSRLWTEHGANPLAAYPNDYRDTDPLMRFASREWGDDVSPYGPLWNLFAGPITLLAGDRMTLALVGFNLLAALSVLAGAWVIARTLAALRPADAATGALVYAWNPLVLWEGIGNGHNDTLMTLALLLAFLAWARRRDALVVPLLVVASLIKYVPIILVPLAALAVWRRAENEAARQRLIAWSISLSIVAVAVGFFPFYDLEAVRHSFARQGSLFLTSPAAMAIGLLRDHYATADIKRWAKTIGYSLLLAALVRQATAVWARPARLPRAAFETIFVFLLVATWNFRSWYLVWPVALAALLPWGWPAWRMVAWSAGGLAIYGLFIWVWDWWDTGFYTVQNVGVPLIFGATLLLTAAEVIANLTTRRSGAGTTAPRPAGSPITADG